MLKIIATAIVILTCAATSRAAERELLRCVRNPHFLGAPVYTLSVDEHPRTPSRYYLKMIPLNPMVRPVYLEISIPVHYDNTWLATKDMGRSGFALLYARGSVTLLDVNLFIPQYRAMNTQGPIRDYRCTPAQ